MHCTKIKFLYVLLLCLWMVNKAIAFNPEPDVISYDATIEPDIQKGSIEGKVIIHFRIDAPADSVLLHCGQLEIDTVDGENVAGFERKGGNLIIYLLKHDSAENEVAIAYHGHPTRGLVFEPENDQAYTVFSTSQWMVCNNMPADKALFNLHILVPKDKMCVASGELVDSEQKGDKMQYSFRQDFATPAYTYGFVIGDFNTTVSNWGDVSLSYFSGNYSKDELLFVFRETPAMMSFFESISGVKYESSVYGQILIGNHYQEMSGFAVLKNAYGKMVLQDSTETNLISHELAHQWWGNRITCKSWNHFWLNEAMATYLSAAYNEHRFGREKYNSDIASYYQVYKEIQERGHDKSLVFEDWLNPTSDDRNLVYFKGAYALHLLREELGDELFWEGIRYYSRKFFGKSVETIDFQQAMETSSGIDLQNFFNHWVYAIK